MTRSEFNKGFTGGMKARYNDVIYHVASCDFEEYTVGLLPLDYNDNTEILWLKHEEIEIVK